MKQADVPEHADVRLRRERTIWLATVDRDGTPAVRPVWFLWDDELLLLYSKPTAAKVGHIRANPRVCLHLDPNEWGEDVVILTGEARFAPERPRADESTGYIAKYRDGLERFGLTAEQLGTDYSVAIEVEPQRFLTY
jgi:PPOX class probable F420-dependent enzyme